MDYAENLEDGSSLEKNITIVGIVASPEKLDGLERFLQHIPAQSGLALVIAQHGVDQRAASFEPLVKLTSLETFEAQHHMEIQPNCMYVLPPQVQVEVVSRRFIFNSPPSYQEQLMPADRFLSSLAEDMGNKAICILFSGKGIDCNHGVAAIKRSNGMVIVEKQRGTEEVLPSENVEYFKEHYILLPEEMSQHILDHIKFYLNHTKEFLEEERIRLFSILRQTTDVDFNYYKQSTILRRIKRRMGMQGFYYMRDYNQYLLENENEIVALQKDLLIGVTRFFRDQDAFAIIAEKVIPAIIEQCAEEQTIRIWVAGCSTGEEVYSLAILFKEYLQNITTEYDVKIFATDVDKEALQYASRGIFPDTIAGSIPSNFISKHFTLKGNEYQIHKEIREMVIFSQHNIIKDPPFIQLDLIVCRNMLIYLKSEMQKKVVSLFHFALKPDAFLFLGPSETLGNLTHLFKMVDNKWNVYQYMEIENDLNISDFEFKGHVYDKKLGRKNNVIARLKETERILKLDVVYTKLIEEYIAAFIIVDENNDILHINGNASTYLTIPRGKCSLSLFKMIPEYLSTIIGTALHRVRKEQKEVVYRDVTIKKTGILQMVNIVTKPFVVNSVSEKLTIIFFEEVEERKEIKVEWDEDPNQLMFNMETNNNQHIKELKLELFHTKEMLHATIEELETSHEEFQAANEELIVANEEFQSTNEELQMVNEELLAVNNEHQYKIQALTELNTDMSNFFNSTQIATVFLDNNMLIRKFSPSITEEIPMMDVDIGRPIGDISHHLKYNRLVEDIRMVLFTGEPVIMEIESFQGKWYSMKILPYLTGSNNNQGVIITLIDVSELKIANEELVIQSYVVQQSPNSIIIIDLERKIKYINAKYSEQAGYKLEELMNQELELYSSNLSSDQLDAIWKGVAAGKKWVGELLNKRKNGLSSYEKVTLLPIRSIRGEIIRFLKISEDITEQKNTLELLHKSEMLSAVGQLAAGIAHEIRNPLTALKGFTKLLEPFTEKKNYIEIMSSELDRIETIISELLMLARPQKIQFERQNVSVILQEVIMLLDTQAILNNVEIITKFEHSVPEINCVQNQLKQVFINILKNGIEAMPQGGNLIVKLKVVENKVLISFTDHGVGIPKSKLSKLGTPFYTTKQTGTGLGLMMSYKIIENHQGSIQFTSTRGRGTTVTITL